MHRWVGFGLVGGLLAGCPGSPVDGDTDAAETDHTDVAPAGSFAKIEKLIARNCTTIGCHAGPEEETGLDLEKGKAYDQLVDHASTQVPSLKRVSPNDPTNSYLMAKLEGEHETVGGEGDIMPPGFGLAQGDRDAFREWIAAGAPAE